MDHLVKKGLWKKGADESRFGLDVSASRYLGHYRYGENWRSRR